MKPVAGFNTNPQNINKNGRPPRDWTVSGLIEEAMEEADETGVPAKKIIYQKLVALAKRGDMLAVKEINQRLDGMPKQTNEVNGQLDIKTLTVKFIENAQQRDTDGNSS